MSRLLRLQARFQERQIEVREQKLAEMLESQHQPAITGNRTAMSSTYRLSPAGSATSTNSIASSISEISSLEESLRVGGRVRQMFEERRKNGGGPLPVPTGWENQVTGRTPSSKSDPTSDARGKNGVRGRPRFNAPVGQKSLRGRPPNGAGKSARGGGSQGSTMRRSRSIHQLENGEYSGGDELSSSSPPSLQSQLQQPKTYNQRGNALRSSSQPPRRNASDLNGNNAEALAILDGADLPVQDKQLLKQMFQEERRRLQEEMERREESLKAKIKQQEEELKRLSSGTTGPTKPRQQQGNKKPVRNVTQVIKRNSDPSPPDKAHHDEPQMSQEEKVRTNAAARRAYKPPKPVKSSHAPAPAAKPRASPTAPSAPSTAAVSAGSVPGAKKSAPPAPVQRGPPPEGMSQCAICGRNFNSDRLEKHQTICEKTNTKVRKKFDASKVRTQDLEPEVAPAKKGKGKAGDGKGKAPPKSSGAQSAGGDGKKRDWRAKREEFLEAMREAKKVQKHLAAGGKLEDLPPPKPMDTSDYIQCPHCGRKFAEGAADRHIPKCANIKSNKPR